jgi:hypothetical protein
MVALTIEIALPWRLRMPASGRGFNGAMQNLDVLGGAIASACLISITLLEFRFLAFFTRAFSTSDHDWDKPQEIPRL